VCISQFIARPPTNPRRHVVIVAFNFKLERPGSSKADFAIYVLSHARGGPLVHASWGNRYTPFYRHTEINSVARNRKIRPFKHGRYLWLIKFSGHAYVPYARAPFISRAYVVYRSGS